MILFIITVLGLSKAEAAEVTEKQTIYKTIVIEKNKTTTRTDNTMLWLGMFLIVVVAVFAWFYFPKIKTGI